MGIVAKEGEVKRGGWVERGMEWVREDKLLVTTIKPISTCVLRDS